ITLVLMPLLLYPLLSIAFRQLFLVASLTSSPDVEYRIGFFPENNAREIISFLRLDKPSDGTRAPAGAGLASMLEPRFTLQTADKLEDLEDAIRSGFCEVGIHVLGLQAVPGPQRKFYALNCRLLVREDSTYGKQALQHIEERLARYNSRFLEEVLNFRQP